MTLEEARDHVGHGVVYRSGTPQAEVGVITGVGALVFVRYAGDVTAKATYPGDLTLLADVPTEAPEGPCGLCGEHRPAGLLKRVSIGGEWTWTCTDRGETHG